MHRGLVLGLLAWMLCGFTTWEWEAKIYDDPATCGASCPFHGTELASFPWWERRIGRVTTAGGYTGFVLGTIGDQLWTITTEHGQGTNVITFIEGPWAGNEYRRPAGNPYYRPLYENGTVLGFTLVPYEAFEVVPECDEDASGSPFAYCTGYHQADGTAACQVAGTCDFAELPGYGLPRMFLNQLDTSDLLILTMAAGAQTASMTWDSYLECNPELVRGGTGCDQDGLNCTSFDDPCCVTAYASERAGCVLPGNNLMGPGELLEPKIGGRGVIAGVDGCVDAGYTRIGPYIGGTESDPNKFTSALGAVTSWEWATSIGWWGRVDGQPENTVPDFQPGDPGRFLPKWYIDWQSDVPDPQTYCPGVGTGPTPDPPPTARADTRIAHSANGDSGSPSFIYSDGAWWYLGSALNTTEVIHANLILGTLWNAAQANPGPGW